MQKSAAKKEIMHLQMRAAPTENKQLKTTHLLRVGTTCTPNNQLDICSDLREPN
jgi:hypothetical protein